MAAVGKDVNRALLGRRVAGQTPEQAGTREAPAAAAGRLRTYVGVGFPVRAADAAHRAFE